MSEFWLYNIFIDLVFKLPHNFFKAFFKKELALKNEP